jgi:hypothetical protein
MVWSCSLYCCCEVLLHSVISVITKCLTRACQWRTVVKRQECVLSPLPLCALCRSFILTTLSLRQSVKHECLSMYLLIITLHIVMFCVLLVLTPIYVCSQNWKKRLLPLSCLSVCPSVAQNELDPTGQIFTKFDVWAFFKNPLRIFNFD